MLFLTFVGQRPIDQQIGFLPQSPVNETSEQGFIAYSILPKEGVPNLSIITAKASVTFDEYEPIDTPTIFNTVSDFCLVFRVCNDAACVCLELIRTSFFLID